MVMTVAGFLRIFKDAGLSTATVQQHEITHSQVSNLFWINVALSGAITLVVASVAPLIAWFYREPRLVGITLLLSITFLLTGLTVQHLALLSRQMRFKSNRGDPGRFTSSWLNRRHRHGLAEVRILVLGGDAIGKRDQFTSAGLVNFSLASPASDQAQPNVASPKLWGQRKCEQLLLHPCSRL